VVNRCVVEEFTLNGEIVSTWVFFLLVFIAAALQQAHTSQHKADTSNALQADNGRLWLQPKGR